jgi:hypothetical protein
VSGLNPGFTYYIAVDGKNGQVGTFSLFIIESKLHAGSKIKLKIQTTKN